MVHVCMKLFCLFFSSFSFFASHIALARSCVCSPAVSAQEVYTLAVALFQASQNGELLVFWLVGCALHLCFLLLLFFFNQLFQRCWRLQCHCLNMAVNLVSITHCTPLLSCCVQVCPPSSSPLSSSSFPSFPSFTPLLSLQYCSLYDNLHDPSASKILGWNQDHIFHCAPRSRLCC